MTPREIFNKISENWIYFILIIFILGFVWWNAATIDSQKVDVVNRCNEHWKKQLTIVCPALANQSENIWMNIDVNESKEKDEIIYW